jgi:branched-chain amino acid transport system ATP-binding protein
MLELRDISTGYGGMPVVHDIDLSVKTGEIVTLVGANGAGKSTLAKTVSGLLRPHRGEIWFESQPIEGLSTRARVKLGVVHVPEGRQTFAGLTVSENLEMGGLLKYRSARDVTQRIKEVCELFPVLSTRMNEVVANFSGGQQQMLAIARGLMASPKLLILDEPSLGLSPVLVAEVFRLIAKLRDTGTAILLSEQNARRSLAIADRGYVIENGRVVMSASGTELLGSGEIAARYLGVGADTQAVSASRDQERIVKLRELMSE